MQGNLMAKGKGEEESTSNLKKFLNIKTVAEEEKKEVRIKKEEWKCGCKEEASCTKHLKLLKLKSIFYCGCCKEATICKHPEFLDKLYIRLGRKKWTEGQEEFWESIKKMPPKQWNDYYP